MLARRKANAFNQCRLLQIWSTEICFCCLTSMIFNSLISISAVQVYSRKNLIHSIIQILSIKRSLISSPVYPFTLSFKLGPGPGSNSIETKYLPEDLPDPEDPLLTDIP